MTDSAQTVAGADIHLDRILILDFGSQYTQLIARRVREAGVYSAILPWDTTDDRIRDFSPKGIILSGSPESVTQSKPPQAPMAVFTQEVPVLGICFGMQTMAAQLGGKVGEHGKKEFGYASVTVGADSRLLEDIEDHDDNEGRGVLDVWMSHGDRVEELPPWFEVIATGAWPVRRRAVCSCLRS